MIHLTDCLLCLSLINSGMSLRLAVCRGFSFGVIIGLFGGFNVLLKVPVTTKTTT